MKRALHALFVVAAFAASGFVIGFCLGGLYGTRFGTHEGHGLGDLGYLFYGAAFGLLTGVVAGIVALRRGAQLRFALSPIAMAALVATATALFVRVHGGW